MKAPRAARLRQRLWRSLGARARILRRVTEAAASVGARVFLVGGPVRDLVLKRPLSDLDVLVSDRLEEVAKRAAEGLHARVVLRPEFLTATLEGEGFRLDLVRARRERYPRPGALPRVEPATLEEDLCRRDFSIHALALPLDAREEPALLDPTGGLEDLERGRVRALHPRSFRDDPTRLFRAARYCARLRFRLTRETRELAHAAVRTGALDTLSGDRVLHELERLLDEAEPERAGAWTERLELFGGLVRGWNLGREAGRGLARLGRCASAAPWPEAGAAAVRRACGLGLLLVATSARVRDLALERIGLVGRPAAGLRADLAALRRLRRLLGRPLSPGRLDAALQGSSEAALLLAYCAGEVQMARQVARYASSLRRAPSPLRGEEARALGLAGAEIGELLRAARRRALDGDSVDERWLRRWLARRQRMG